MTREEFLLDTLNYYCEDTSRRCVNATGGCFYSPTKLENTKSQGCAIGRWLTPEVQLKLDSFDETSVYNVKIFNRLPLKLRNYGREFLREVQKLHDDSDCWDKTRLTIKGKTKLKQIIELYKFNKNKFKRFYK